VEADIFLEVYVVYLFTYYRPHKMHFSWKMSPRITVRYNTGRWIVT